MYYQNYEDYMQSVLGYRNDMNSTNTYHMPEDYYPMNNTNHMNNMSQVTQQLEDMYPEIYRLVYPMINKACSMNTKPVTEEVVDEITNSVFTSIEANMEAEVNVKMELRNGDVKNPNAKSEKPKETRAPNNTLRDLIRILVIRELLRRHGRPLFPGRPTFPPGGRPPFPGGPGMPPPPRPREMGDYDMYY